VVEEVLGSTPEALQERRTLNMPSQAGGGVWLSGANLGQYSTSSSSRVGATGAASSAWVSDSSMTLRAVRGLRSSLHLLVTTGTPWRCSVSGCAHQACLGAASACSDVLSGSLSEALSYDTPWLSGISHVSRISDIHESCLVY
jgi:hypothetical protein